MSKLYDIANDFASLMSEDLDPEMIADTIEGMEGEFSDKVENMLAMIKNESAYGEALKAEADKLTARKKAIDNRVANIKQYIVQCMNTMEKKSFTAGVHQISMRKATQTVSIDCIERIPTDFVEYETVMKVDKNVIKKHLKAGNTLEGCSLKTGKPSLIIK